MRILLLILILIRCKNPGDSTNQSTIKVNSDSIEYNHQIIENELRQKNRNKCENALLEIVGLTNPDSIDLGKNDIIYHFKTIGEKASYFEIIEINSQASKREIECEKVKFEIDENCYPFFDNQRIDSSCVNIINSKKYKINSTVIDSLNKYLVEKEYWEQKETLSSLRTHNNVRYYHGITLDYTATYALHFKTKDNRDTFFTEQHRVIRAPIDSKILTNLSKTIENVLENKMPDDNNK